MSSQTARKCPLCNGGAIRDLQYKTFQDFKWALALCESCGLHFTSPTPTSSQIQRFYSGDFHAQLREEGAGEKVLGPRFTSYADWIARYVPSGKALDVGCATGLLPRLLKDRGYNASGLEINPETAKWGAAHYGIEIEVGGLEKLSSEVNVYDLITLTEVVEHTPNPIEFLTGVNRLLKSRGYALVTFPDISCLKSRYYRMLSKLSGRDWVWVSNRTPLHIWEFSYKTANVCFERAGFSIAGFRRTEVDGEFGDKHSFLGWPIKPLNLAPLAKQFGSQMEFVIRKNS